MDDLRPVRRAFLRQLKRLGYGCMFRRAGWCEVLVWREEERWLGEGPHRRAALDAVLARMFPSAAARALLVEHELRSEPEKFVLPEPVSAPAPPPPAVFPPPAAVAVAAAIAVARQPASLPLARLPSAELRALHEELEELEATLTSIFVDVLEWSPERQRLILLAWVARARDIQTRARRESSIETRVSGFCSRLGMLAKIGWPGSVPALALSALPMACGRELALAVGDEPREWIAVADRAEMLLAELDSAAGRLDEQGWADEAFLEPAPPDPRSILCEVRAELEAWTGPIPDAQAVLDGAESSSEPPVSLAQSLPADPARGALLRNARRLRWLRGCDLPGWAETFGRLRWLAHRGRQLASPELEQALDPRARPRQSWAKECGHDPAARERKHKKNELYRALLGLARQDAARLREWLCAAFEVGPEMGNDKLAAALREREADVLALDAEDFGERAQRSRLRRLQEILRGTPAPGSTPESVAAEMSEGRGESGEPRLEVEAIPPTVLEFTRERRALIVGNRADPALDEALQRAFEFALLDRCDLAPNRIESHADRVRAGSYDLVLAITGFMPHKTDHALRKACASAGIRYVRVNKGRPSACARHLARELGLHPAGVAFLT